MKNYFNKFLIDFWGSYIIITVVLLHIKGML